MWIWQALEYRPQVVVIEYNSVFDYGDCKVVPYEPTFQWDGTNYFGASYSALEILAREKQYVGVYTNGVNAFFVDKACIDNWQEFVGKNVFVWRDRHGADPHNRPFIQLA